jgi:antitoxin component of RelBE/YafQ-DinJ toxin-antitoxin module
MAECVMAAQADVTILVTAIDEELYTRLLVVANRMGVSVSDVAMLALANYLEEK